MQSKQAKQAEQALHGVLCMESYSLVFVVLCQYYTVLHLRPAIVFPFDALPSPGSSAS
jgi:hypothetical protein